MAPAPADRPWFERRAVRVLLCDEADRVLLLKDSDLGLDPVVRWWMTPGGGVDLGESDVGAAVRELREETGLVVSMDRLQGPLLERRVLHGYSDKVVDQVEVFFAVRVPAFEVDTSGHTEEEQLTVTEIRWWTQAELKATDEEVWPRDLLDLLTLATRPDRWREGAFSGPPVEESSLAADVIEGPRHGSRGAGSPQRG